MPSEWAKKTADEIIVRWETSGRFAPLVSGALDAARAAALEEAANVANSVGKRYEEACKRAGVISVMSLGCFQVAADIRALIEQEPTA